MAKKNSSKPKNPILNKSLELLRDNEGRIIKEGEFFEECFTIINLSNNKLFDEAGVKIDDIIKNIEGIEYIYFLEAINYYLGNLAHKEEDFSYNNSYKKNVKAYLKLIKRALNHLEACFDEKHLLYYRKEDGAKRYYAIDNAVLLSFLDELTQILNHFGFNKEADKFFMLKGKLELGFSRYLFFSNERIVINDFYKTGEFNIADQREIAEIFKYYIIDEIFFKDFIAKIKEEVKKGIEDTKNYLDMLYIIKNMDESFVATQIKKNKKYLEQYGKKVVSKNEFQRDIKISRSINKDFKIASHEIKGEGKVLVHTNSQKILNRLIRVL